MKLIRVLLFMGTIGLVKCDYYSAISGLETLLNNEMFLVQNLESYIKAERYKNSFLRNYMNNAENEIKKIKQNALGYYGNPLNAWKAIKRMTRDWQDYVKITIDLRNANDYQSRLATHDSKHKFIKPSVEDLRGAAKGMSRLQRTYNLETQHLANGTIIFKKVSKEMTSSDCFALGWSLLVEKEFQNAAAWLLEARCKLSQEKKAGKTDGDGSIRQPRESAILENLVPAISETGNTKLAFWLAKEYLAINPQNEKISAMLSSVKARMNAERLALSRGAISKPPKTRETLRDLYEKTCRGELHQTPKEQRHLRCRYESYNGPYSSIAPFKMEELSLDPFVAVYYDVIYDSEIKNIFRVSAQNVTRSRIGGSIANKVSDIRTSKNTWLFYQQNPFLQNIAHRLTYITGLTLETAEALQVANYGIGGHYGAHYDFIEDDSFDLSGKGNRIMTAMFYINDVELGGATAFPYLKLIVPPVKRSLVVWYNLHRSLEYDYRMKHAGCPVIKGSKWICNEWYHTVGQEFYRPCGLKPDGYKSIRFSDKNMW